MKNMYKGVLTVAVATAVASAAIMMSGKKTSAETNEANETVVNADQNAVAGADSKAAVATSQQTTNTDAATSIVKQASDTVAKGADSSVTCVA
jgi:predicted kinase